MNSKILKKVNYTQADGSFSLASERIIRETQLTIKVNGYHLASAMILATMEKEYIYGHLFGHGVINNASDIISLTVKNDIAEVTLKNNISRSERPLSVYSDFKISKEDVFESVRSILKSEIFSETEAVHSAGLFLDGREAICIAEDLGRHNALDKVIGGGLLLSTDFRRSLAASTGRQPSEMIYKCLNAGIPIIATKGVPTTLAIEIAEKAGITIVGLVRGPTMTIYSHPERIQ